VNRRRAQRNHASAAVPVPDYDKMWSRLEDRLPWMIEEAQRREAFLKEHLKG